MVETTDFPIRSPENPYKKLPENANLFSPGFRSVAATAGWDEEALLIASLVVEDTPDRHFKQKKRLKSPASNSTRKRKGQRRSLSSIPVVVLQLDEDDPKSKHGEKEKIEVIEREKIEVVEKEKRVDEEMRSSKSGGVSTSIPCIDRLREELSCAICLEICYEPSTTSCGHSFCKKCLRSAADKCGKKCPKCRHLISNGKYCTVNTVLWNTIQLLFPQEVEARRKADSASGSPEPHGDVLTRAKSRNRVVEAVNSPEPERNEAEIRRNHHRVRSRRDVSRRAVLAGQDEDAALALRLQREEFMEAFREPADERINSL